MKRSRRGFLVRAVLTISSLSLFCCLVVILETVHEINSDHLLRASDVNNHFNGFPSALASYNDKNTKDGIFPNLQSESLYREQGRALKSFPKLKHWEEYQNSPSYNKTLGKLPSLSTGLLGCSDIKAIKVVRNIGRGYTKTVQKGLYRDIEVAIKSVRLDNEDIKRCVLHPTANRTVEECFIFAKYKLAKEMIMLQQLRHANIVKLLGFCWQNELNTADLKTRGLTMVTEIGSTLDVITLVQLPWQERFRICLGLARLLSYLAHSPLGSLVIRDFKLSQFILVSGEIKLTDFDDIDNEEPTCSINKDCVVRGAKRNKTLQCDGGRCRGVIAAKNLDFASRGVISHILIPGAPEKLQSYLNQIKYNIQTLTWSSDELVWHLERVLDLLRLGKHLEPYTRPTNFYKELPNADFPNLHDYDCSNSRLFGACELAVYDITEAKYKCDMDDRCKAFVTTTKTLWTGVDRSLFNGVQVALHVTHHVIQCGKDIRHVTSLPISFLPGNEGRERLPSLWSSHGTRDIAGVDVRFEVVRVPPGRWKSYMSMKEKHEPRLKPRLVLSEQYARLEPITASYRDRVLNLQTWGILSFVAILAFKLA